MTETEPPTRRRRGRPPGSTLLAAAVTTVAPVEEAKTTGWVAKALRVAPRTVSKWIDSGQLVGYRLAGSSDRRVPLSELRRFCERHGMPCPPQAAPTLRAYLGLYPGESVPGCEPVADPFSLGVLLVARGLAFLVVGDVGGRGLAEQTARLAAERYPAARVVLVLSEDAPATCEVPGVTVVRRPLDVAALGRGPFANEVP